ncbi:unnamed protein product [Darwinula stevensoni]|uniref:Uncharacterized protein n=1 Tax=Darwinula stevensoni TaxID=69355 RepID=A0A7R9A333_9CRUS|nr:unnamed protein product [Darwinula stevensoni]CAG0890934.1 unnamed protein product [Darwinula stevensoni]
MVELVMYCSVSTNYAERLLTTNAIVSSTGEVALLTAANFRSTCDVDVSSFPFDIQNCTMRFGSWSYDMTMVTRSLLFCLPDYIFLYTNGSPQLLVTRRNPVGKKKETFQIQLELDHNKTLELLTYTQNEEFILESYEAGKGLVLDACCPKPFSIVEYVIRIKRRSAFFVVSYVLPMVVINIIGMMSFSPSFLMPSESGEKVTLGISAMLTTIVFLMTIRDILPPTENMPLIGKYYCASICLVSLEVVLSIFTLYLHHLKDIRVSLRIQNVCRLLAKLTCMQQPNFRTVIVGACENEKGKKEFSDGISIPSLFGAKMKSSRRHAWKGPVVPISNEPISEWDLTLRGVPLLTESQEKREWEREMWISRCYRQVDMENWRIVSCIMDRFFLYLFALLNFAVTIGILFSSPRNG